MSIEILASKFWNVLEGTLGVYRTQSKLHSFSCVRISEQDVWRWWLTGTDFR